MRYTAYCGKGHSFVIELANREFCTKKVIICRCTAINEFPRVSQLIFATFEALTLSDLKMYMIVTQWPTVVHGWSDH